MRALAACTIRFICSLVLLAALPGATAHSAAQAGGRDVLLLLDASGSMWTKSGRYTRIGDVRAVVPAVLRKFERTFNLGIAAFGHTQAANCGGFQRLLRIAPVNSEQAGKALADVNPKGAASIAAGLAAGARLLRADQQPATMILIADGADTCRADPCKAALQLAKTAPDLRIDVVALSASETDKIPLACVAGATRGTFIAVKDRRQLTGALTKLLLTAKRDMQIARADIASKAPEDNAIVTGSVEQSGAPTPIPGRKPLPPGAKAKPAKPVPAPDATKRPKVRPQTARLNDAIRNGQPPRPSAPEFVVREEKSDTAALRLSARLTAALEPIRRPVDWTVYRIDPAEKGKWIQVTERKQARPTIALEPGEYVVRADYGHAKAAKIVTTKPGTLIDASFILNAGALRILPNLVTLTAPPGQIARQWIYPKTANGTAAKPVATSTIAGEIIRLNAGHYRLVSKFGAANAVVETTVTIRPGRLTEIEINHKAGVARFRLTGANAKKLKRKVRWRLLDDAGTLVVASEGTTPPAALLAPGRYKLSAKIAGKTYRNAFKIDAGQTRDIAVEIK